MKRIVLFITALLLFAGCAKEQLVEERSYTGPVTVIEATFESLNNDATKAEVTDAGTFTWQNGDKAAFTVASGSSYLTGTNSSTTATAVFSINGSPSFTSSSFAFYPSDLTSGTETSSLAVKVPVTREWVKDQTNVAMYGAKVENEASFNFTHMGGLVRVRVNNVPTNARKFVFRTPEYKINGEFNIASEGGYNVIKTATSSTESEQTYTLTWTTAPTPENTMDFYIPLPLGTYANGFTFKFLDGTDAEILSKTSSHSETIVRKDLVLMPAITLVGGSIEPVEKAAIVANIPAGYSGDYLLPQSEKVILKINASDSDKDITLKYDGANIPTNLEVKVVDGDNAGNYNAKLLGNLPSTHVEFTQGHIDATELTTSSSTLAVINPATVGTLTVKGGNVLLKGATVTSIVVDENAVASEETQAPVQIEMQKYTPTGGTEQTPAVSEKITANADVVVAPESGVDVKVAAAENVQVANEGAGTVKDMSDHPIETKAAAKIGEVKYITLADAIVAVQNDQTITMLCDVDKANGISVPSGKNFTVDFGGYKYAMECPGAGSAGTKTIGFQLLENSNIVFKNGTIKCTDANKEKTWNSGDDSKGIAMMIQNYANLTLDGITIDATNIAHNGVAVRYALSNNSGNVEYKGATSIITAAGDYAFDVCKYSTYAAPTVTWNSTGSVDGIIEISGGEFILGHNLEVKQPIKVIAPATLDLKTYTLSGSSDFTKQKRGVVIVNRGGELTINGTTGTIDGATNKVYSAVTMTEMEDTGDNVAKLTVNGGTLKGYYYGISGNGSRHNTEINIKGGNILGTCAAPDDGNVGIFHPQDGTLNITGGTIEGYSSAVEVRAGTVNITGGSLKSTATTFSCEPNSSGNTTVGAALAIAQHTTRKAINVTIDGGTFTGYKAISVEDPETGDPQNVNVVINGGSFSDEEVIKYAAKDANITVSLEKDRTAGTGVFVKADQNQRITFKLNTHTFTVAGPAVGSSGTQTQAFHFEKGNTITIENGIIECHADNKEKTWTSDASEKGIAMIIQNYANLTLDNVCVDATNIAHNGNNARYAVSNNCGTVEFKGNTTIKAPVAGDFAFDVCKSGSYSEPKVTWNSTGSVTGKIELTGGEFVVAKDLALTQPIRTKDAAAKLTVNANITPASGWNAGDALVIVNRTGNLTVNGSGKISNNSNGSVYSAVKMTEKDEADEASTDAQKAKLTVGGTVTLEGDYYGISGNGSRHGTEITVNGGTIKGVHENDNLGIYHPQQGTLTISGGTIEGYSSAVEMRAGTLEITGGTFTSTASPYDFTQNGSGNTIKGVAIAISEHSTNKGITAKLDGGTFTGGAYQLGVAGLNDRINITKAPNLEITVNSGYKWDDNKLVVDAQN